MRDEADLSDRVGLLALGVEVPGRFRRVEARAEAYLTGFRDACQKIVRMIRDTDSMSESKQFVLIGRRSGVVATSSIVEARRAMSIRVESKAEVKRRLT